MLKFYKRELPSLDPLFYSPLKSCLNSCLTMLYPKKTSESSVSFDICGGFRGEGVFSDLDILQCVCSNKTNVIGAMI